MHISHCTLHIPDLTCPKLNSQFPHQNLNFLKVFLILLSGKSSIPFAQARNIGVIQFIKLNKMFGSSNSLEHLVRSAFQNISRIRQLLTTILVPTLVLATPMYCCYLPAGCCTSAFGPLWPVLLTATRKHPFHQESRSS